MSKSSRRSKVVSYIAIPVFSLLTTMAYSQEVKTAAEGGPEANIDRPGSDFDNFTLPAPPSGMLDIRVDQCSQACAKNSKCQAWTYVKPNYDTGTAGTVLAERQRSGSEEQCMLCFRNGRRSQYG